MGSVANELSSVYADSLRNAGNNIQNLCQTFAGAATCSADQIKAGIILGNEKGFENTQKELCAEVKAGAPEADVVQRAGFAEGTKLNCSTPGMGR